MKADFKIILRQRRIIALTDRAKSYMHGQTCSISNPCGYLDMVMAKSVLEHVYHRLSYAMFSAVDGNGKKLRRKFLF